MNTAIELALELTEEVPDELRSAGFSVVLQHLLKDTCSSGAAAAPEIPDDSEPADPESPKPNSIPPARIVKAGTRDQQAIWAVLTLAARNEDATTAAICAAIKDELGCTPEDQRNLSARLRRMTSQYVTRKKSERSYVYMPTSDAPEVFANDEEQ